MLNNTILTNSDYILYNQGDLKNIKNYIESMAAIARRDVAVD